MGPAALATLTLSSLAHSVPDEPSIHDDPHYGVGIALGGAGVAMIVGGIVGIAEDCERCLATDMGPGMLAGGITATLFGVAWAASARPARAHERRNGALAGAGAWLVGLAVAGLAMSATSIVGGAIDSSSASTVGVAAGVVGSGLGAIGLPMWANGMAHSEPNGMPRSLVMGATGVTLLVAGSGALAASVALLKADQDRASLAAFAVAVPMLGLGVPMLASGFHVVAGPTGFGISGDM